jgi:hypothetical protein
MKEGRLLPSYGLKRRRKSEDWKIKKTQYLLPPEAHVRRPKISPRLENGRVHIAAELGLLCRRLIQASPETAIFHSKPEEIVGMNHMKPRIHLYRELWVLFESCLPTVPVGKPRLSSKPPIPHLLWTQAANQISAAVYQLLV